MRYRLREIPGLLTYPAGRIQFREGLRYRLWPVTSRLAKAYRRTWGRRVRVIAVVGSAGKSTTVRAVAAVLQVPLVQSTLNNAWGSVSRAVMRLSRKRRHAVIEVGIADKGQMRGYADVVRPDIVVVTSIGSEHQRSLGTLDVTRDEKAWMVRALPADGIAVLNGDDPNVMWMASQTRARVVTYGYGESCDVRALQARIDWPHGTLVRVAASGQERDMALRLLGRHMTYPALAAIAVGLQEGLALDDAIARLAVLEPTAGRMQPVALPSGATIVRDEFKSAVDTLDAALDAFAEIPARRRIVVLGDISEPPDPQHATYRRIGERVGHCASRFLVVGSMHEPYAQGARRAGLPKEHFERAGRTPREAAARLAELLEPGDVVLVKGRDTQKLERITLILQGRKVACDIRFCDLRLVGCDECPMLERGWGSREPTGAA